LIYYFEEIEQGQKEILPRHNTYKLVIRYVKDENELIIEVRIKKDGNGNLMVEFEKLIGQKIDFFDVYERFIDYNLKTSSSDSN
jgi:hypothetical protein